MGLSDGIATFQINQNMTTKKQPTAKILLVDDEPNILIALEFLMNQQGYTVETAKDGQTALKIMESFVPDVVLLDVMMPGMDGFEVAKKIRENSDLEKTQIIFLTAKGTKEDRQKGYKSGGEIYLIKPFNNEELIEAVAYALKM